MSAAAVAASLVAVLITGSSLALAADDPPSPAAAPAPADPDAEIQERLDAGDVARAGALADAAIARDETELNLAPGARADHIERIALRFYEAGTASSAQCERLYEKSLALRETEGESHPAELASTLHDFAGILYNRGAFVRAEELWGRALAIRERVLPPSDPATAGTRRDLGVVALSQGRLAEAEAHLVPAMAVLEASPDEEWLQVAVGRNDLGELRRQQGDYESAAKFLEGLARDAEKKLGDKDPQFPSFLNNLAGVYKDQERYDDAESLLRRSLALRRSAKAPDTYSIARAELNLAEVYREQGKFEEAAPLYVSALADARKALGPRHPELFEFLNQLAVLRRDQGQLAKAESPMREALALAERGFGPDAPRVGWTHLDLAELLRLRGQCPAARPHLDRAITIREKAYGPAHPDVAEALVESAACRPKDAAGRRAARAELDRAIGILEGSEAHPAVEVKALETRARLLRPTDKAGATRDLDAAIGAVERMRPHRGGGERTRASFLGQYKRLYDLAVRWDIEEGRVDRALATADRARARVLLDQLNAAGVGDASGRDPDLARRLTESRTRLAETRERLVFEQAREDLPAKERVHRVAELERRLAEDARGFRELHDEARNTSPAWRGVTNVPHVSTSEIQHEIVPRGGWLLFYQIGDERSYLIAVRPEGAAQVFDLKAGAADAASLGIAPGPLTTASLTRALLGERGKAPGAAFREGLLAALALPPVRGAAPIGRSSGALRGIGGITTGSGPGESGLRALWRSILPAALWAKIRGASQVLVVPDGPLFLLPLEALVISPGADPGSTRYWLDDGPVVRYAPSASFLLELQRQEAARGARPLPDGQARALSVADPAYGAAAAPVPPHVVRSTGEPDSPARTLRGPTLARLPGTAHESDLVREALVGVAEVVVLRGDAAREPAVRAELDGKRYLHIATHALVDQEGGDLFAALALTPPPPGAPRGDDDGFLQLFEIYDLRMDCDLAVLSACSSNTGKVVAGEGIFALSRGFLLGGARRVVASQWSVDDLSTADLVGDLFQRLAAADASGGVRDTALALRDAKRSVRRRAEYAHPFYWAPFVITGLE